MVEIYNEQVRDLLSGDSSQKKYPFLCSTFFFFCSFKISSSILVRLCSPTICLCFHSFASLDFHTLGILSTTQQNGLAVPDASMYPVTSTSDVLELMSIGLQNRAVSSTALNERSSRSHRFSYCSLKQTFVLSFIILLIIRSPRVCEKRQK